MFRSVLCILSWIILSAGNGLIAQPEIQVEINSSSSQPHLRLKETEADFARIKFENTANPLKYWDIAGRTLSNDADSRFNFWYFNGTSGKDVLTISGDLRLGICNVDPMARLDVNGKIRIGDDLDSPMAGMIRFQSNVFQGYNGSSWIELGRPNKDSVLISAVAFTGRVSTDTVMKSLGQGGVYIDQTTTSLGLVAPVPLPVGATVTNMVIYYKDEEATRNLVIDFVSEDLTGGFFSTEMTYNSADAVGWVSARVTDNVTVQSLRSYHIRIRGLPNWSGNSNLAVKGVTIVFTNP